MFRRLFTGRNIFLASAAIGGTSMASFFYKNNKIIFSNSDVKYFSKNDLKLHNNKKDGIWVSYKDDVYDITNFVDNHPGGVDKIMLAAGGSVDKYWNIYRQHLNNEFIENEILKPMKIGKLKDYVEDVSEENPYKNDPERDTTLKFHNYFPCNAETPTDSIMDNWITPNNLWYIRNHHPVPMVNKDKYKLKISGVGINEKQFTLDQIKKFPKKEVVTTIQCGGNRRDGLNKFGKTSGIPWGFGAISTAKWGGVLLKDLLDNCNITKELDKNSINHIQVEALESVKISIPVEKALNPFGDVIVAYEMNDEEISREHGYPLRLIVPGYVGIRNLKWIEKITTSSEEADSPWQSGISYKGMPHYIKDAKDISIKKLISINEQPVQSVIVEDTGNDNEICIKGFAWSGGGRGIIRVDVSADNGETWYMANLKEGSEQKINKAWAWTFWDITIPKTSDTPPKIICKATDASFNTQPEPNKLSWNLRGLNNNTWHITS